MLALVGVVAMNFAGTPSASARTYSTETLNYEIVYHWGVVWKHAGDAQLSIKRTSSGYYAQLVGKTRSWAETFYPVRDTLKCWMNSNFVPTKYVKATHEKKYYAVDVVTFSTSNNTTYGKCVRHRQDKPTSSASIATRGTAYDMLSVFYMLRNIDFASLTKNKSYTTVVFSGKTKETLTIKYKGTQNIKLRDGSKHNAFHITFSFTQDGRTKSSDDLDAWLSTGPSRTPLMVTGKLPVGEVKCYLGGNFKE